MKQVAWISSSISKHSAFDQSSPLSLSNSIPQHLLLWGLVGFGSLKGGNIYWVRVPYFESMALSLFFQKVGYVV
jgi:hypothetical protein